MRRLIAAIVLFLFLCNVADVHASIQWFMGNGTGGGATAEMNFRTALSPLVPHVQDFEAFSSGSTVNTIPLAGMNVDVDAITADGLTTEENLRVFAGSFGSPPAGTIDGNALLSGHASQKAIVEFIFPQPVFGFGAWVFDNGMSVANEFELQVYDGTTWQTSTSRIDANVGSTAHTVDGFLGAVLTSGIHKARVLNYDSTTGSLTNTFFELDHVQAAIPEPTALAIWSLLIGLTWAGGAWRYRRRRH